MGKVSEDISISSLTGENDLLQLFSLDVASTY